jgi:Ca2+-binding RTX toxin-like protein
MRLADFFYARHPRRCQIARSRPPGRRRPLVEPLERRVLLSSALLIDDVITITGDPDLDVIQVVQSFGAEGQAVVDVTIDGQLAGQFQGNALGFPPITAISIQALDGPDAVILTDVGLVVTVDAGSGDDAVNAINVTGAMTLFGGAGNDALAGGAGDDRVDGGTGNDSLAGGDGINMLLGGAGEDTLFSGLSSDTLDGGAGNDQLAESADADFTLPAAPGRPERWGVWGAPGAPHELTPVRKPASSPRG